MSVFSSCCKQMNVIDQIDTNNNCILGQLGVFGAREYILKINTYFGKTTKNRAQYFFTIYVSNDLFDVV